MDFAQVSALTPVGAGSYTATLHPHWTIGGRPNGGYLLATIARAAVDVSPHADVLAASAHYLRAPEPGAATVHAEVLRAGRSASQVRAWLAQDGAPCVEVLCTIGTLDPTATPVWSGGVPDPGPTPAPAAGPSPVPHPRDDAVRLPPVNPIGLPVPIMGEVDVRIDRASAGFTVGRPSGRGELWGWLALPGDAAFDPISLLYAVDAFPPATFDIEVTGWVPTLELTAYVRARPAPGPVRILQKANLITDARVDETCWAWDARGRLVAQATQLAGIRLPSR